MYLREMAANPYILSTFLDETLPKNICFFGESQVSTIKKMKKLKKIAFFT